jgi:hypothetical protein
MSFIQVEVIKLLVAGEKIEGDLKNDLTIHDISSEMDEVAHQISWWGGVLAAARAEAEQLESTYRQWRAKQSLMFLERDPKLAEWKVKLKVEAHSDFMRHKNAKALAVRNISQLENVVDAFKVKAEQLRSKGANMRFYMEHEGMTTPASPKKKATRMRREAVVYNGPKCEVCGEPTGESPSGTVCRNGHGGEVDTSKGAEGEKPKAVSSTERQSRTERVRAKIKKRQKPSA